RLNRSVVSVQQRRNLLGRPPAANPFWRPWTAEEEALVGKMRDEEVAARTGHSIKAVCHRRLALGLPAFEPKFRLCTHEDEAIVGTDPDKHIAQRLRRHVGVVRLR